MSFTSFHELLATDGDLFSNEFAERKPAEHIYVLPEFPSSKLFINQAKNILKGVGPKTRKVNWILYLLTRFIGYSRTRDITSETKGYLQQVR